MHKPWASPAPSGLAVSFLFALKMKSPRMSLLKPTLSQLSHGDGGQRVPSRERTVSVGSEWGQGRSCPRASPFPRSPMHSAGSLFLCCLGKAERKKALLCLCPALPAQSPFPESGLAFPLCLVPCPQEPTHLWHPTAHTSGCFNAWLHILMTLRGSTGPGIPLPQSICCSFRGVEKKKAFFDEPTLTQAATHTSTHGTPSSAQCSLPTRA